MYSNICFRDRRIRPLCHSSLNARQVMGLLIGRGGIRTPGSRKRSSVFKTDAFDHSATLPCVNLVIDIGYSNILFFTMNPSPLKMISQLAKMLKEKMGFSDFFLFLESGLSTAKKGIAQLLTGEKTGD